MLLVYFIWHLRYGYSQVIFLLIFEIKKIWKPHNQIELLLFLVQCCKQFLKIKVLSVVEITIIYCNRVAKTGFPHATFKIHTHIIVVVRNTRVTFQRNIFNNKICDIIFIFWTLQCKLSPKSRLRFRGHKITIRSRRVCYNT